MVANKKSAVEASTHIGYEILKIVGTVLVLEVVGLAVAIFLTWSVASAFGQNLEKYPWHVVLFIDLAFILFSAVLAEFAEGPSQGGTEDALDARTWTLASFIIAVGTLAPLASHAGKIWLWIIATLLLLVMALGLASGKIVFGTRKIRLTIRHYRTSLGEVNELLRKLLPLLICTGAIVMSAAVLGIVGALVLTLKNLLLERLWDIAPLDPLFQFLANLLYLTLGFAAVCVALILIAALVTTVGWILPERPKSAPETEPGGDQAPGDDRGKRPVEPLAGAGGSGHTQRTDWFGAAKRLLLDPLARVGHRLMLGLNSAIQHLRKGGSAAVRFAGLLARSARDFVIGQRTRARQFAVGVLALLAVGEAAFMAYEVVRLQPDDGAGGKEALRPSGANFGRAGVPPLTFYRSTVSCSWGSRPVWAHGEVERLQTSSHVQWCGLEPHISIPCWAASIVVAGTASASGTVEAEMQRASERGRSLAQALTRDFTQRCGKRAYVRAYVLNLGPYLQGPHSNDAEAQRELYVLVGGSDGDSREAADAVETYAQRETQFGRYANCAFYSLNAAGEMSLVRNLKCGQRTFGR